MKKKLLLLAGMVLCGALAFGEGNRFGAQLSYGTEDLNIGIGGRFEMPLETVKPNLFLASNFNFFFPDTEAGVDMTALQLDVNALYKYSKTETVELYAGGGLSYDYAKVEVDLGMFGTVEADDSEIGLELTGGAKYKVSNFDAYTEVKYTTGFEAIILSTGILF